MEIEVFNPSSAGASFTDNTNYYYLMYYKEFMKNPDKMWKFSDLRTLMEKSYNINNSNSRNMFTLLKDCQFVKYEKGQQVCGKTFFTELGLAYAKTLESIELLSNEVNDENKRKALEEFQELKQNIICRGLQNILMTDDSNFTNTLKKTIQFLIQFKSIDRIEYALIIYHSSKSGDYINNLKNDVGKYRSKQIDITVKVNTRNDNSSIKGERVLQEIGALTSYTYMCGFLLQSGLVVKDKQSFIFNNQKMELAKNMLKGELNG